MGAGLQGEGGSKRKRSKKKELTDFYVWQKRETKRQRIADLRERFEVRRASALVGLRVCGRMIRRG